MNGKTVVITGANAGIGKVAARELARMGATVVMVCRNAARGQVALQEIRRDSGSDRIELLLADLASQADIRRVSAEFRARHARLDVLLNNAGLYCPTRTLTADGIETTFAVNHLGYFLLTHLLLDVLKASPSARIVNVASGAHKRGRIEFDNLQGERRYSGVMAYSNSKLANILFTRELARRLQGTRVTANCLHPGVVATNIFHNTPRLINWLVQTFAMGPEAGARTSVYLASSPEVEGVTGKYFYRQREKMPRPAALDDAVARRLWALSEQLSGVR
jgi:NAD(P)-dependent dehydrogenase (short-subunit alcohol dehydrogenase family)